MADEKLDNSDSENEDAIEYQVQYPLYELAKAALAIEKIPEAAAVKLRQLLKIMLTRQFLLLLKVWLKRSLWII